MPASSDAQIMAELQDVFLTFCSFGDRKGGGAMDGAKFAKLCRDTKIQGKRVSSTEVDITFSKVKKGRKINFDAFIVALEHLAVRRFPAAADTEAAFDKMATLILRHSGPKTKGTTVDTKGSVYAKLANPGSFTGAYKAHFNEDGTGKGKLDDDSDKVWDLSDITRPNLAKKADIDQRVARNERLEARARSAFKKYDANKSNTIDEKELANLLKDMDLDEDAHEEFEHANASHSGAITFEEFVLYYNEVVQRSRGQRRRRRLAARAEKRSAEAKADRKKRIAEMRAARAAHAAAADGAGGGAGGGAGAGAEEEGSDEDSDGYHDLSSAYESYCKFGHQTNSTEMDNKTFAKMARECHLIKKGKCTMTDIDLIFNKIKKKGTRRITFEQFQQGLELVATKLFPKRAHASAVAVVHDHVVGAGGPQAHGTKVDRSGVYGKLMSP